MRKGFTLIELIFVIVIFGILSKFGADILYKIYENYIFSNTFNRLENQSEAAVKQIANRLQYRIKDSTIARSSTGGGVMPIGVNITGATVLEWIGTDIDGWQGTSSTAPEWSGFIDLSASSAGTLVSRGTDTTLADSGVIFFIGSDVDLGANFGWNGAIADQNASIHRIQFNGGNIEATVGATGFSGVDVYEYYEFAKTAYAVSLEGTDLKFYYDFTPWSGQTLGNAKQSLIMENVKSFKFTSMGDIMVIQVCVSDSNITGVGEYSICKEKVVF